MERAKYFTMKKIEYSFFYVFIFLGMSLHFMYTNGDFGVIAESANMYITYFIVIFGCYGYFAFKAKDYRHDYIRKSTVDVYNNVGNAFASFHKFTPFIMMTVLGLLEFNILNLPYYHWFYSLLAVLTFILFWNIYYSGKINKENIEQNKKEQTT